MSRLQFAIGGGNAIGGENAIGSGDDSSPSLKEKMQKQQREQARKAFSALDQEKKLVCGSCARLSSTRRSSSPM